MGVYGILNILVLALSLATVLLTLLSYLIYKIRQLPFSKQASVKATEGTYFKRYQLDPLSEPTVTNEEGRRIQSLKRFQSAPIFFGTVTLVIFLTLLFQNTTQAWFHGIQNASRIKHMKTLLGKGLLKEYDFNPSLPNPVLTESITNKENRILHATIESIRNKRIGLITLSRNLKLNHQMTLNSTKAWKEFFKVHKIPVKSLLEIPKGDSFDVIILPQAKLLSLQERSDLNELIEAGVGVIATGPSGFLDGTGSKNPEPWATKIWGIQFQKNSDAKVGFPSLFAAGTAPWWDIPPGLLVNWFPTDNSYQAISERENNSIYEANYQGRWRSSDISSAHFVRSVFGSTNGRHVTWLALDPPKIDATDVVQTFYASLAFSQAINWTSGSLIVNIALWPSGSRSSFIASVDSEDQFQNAKQLLKIFKEEEFPATFFVVSNLLASDPAAALDDDESYEVASHTDDHKSMDGKSLENQYQHIQNSRFEIEHISKKKVVGFRPPEEGFDEITLNAAKQNNLSYIFGDQRFHRFAPIRIANDSMTYYPRSTLDDFNLKTKFGSYVEEEIMEALLDDYHRVSVVGGAYFLNLHTQIFGRPEYDPVLRSFLKQISQQAPWKTNFETMSNWWLMRSNIYLSFNSNRITVRNGNSTAIKQIELIIDNLKQGDIDIRSAENISSRIAKDGTTRLLLHKIEPGEEIAIELKSSLLRKISSEVDEIKNGK